jgi:hypothetical protein
MRGYPVFRLPTSSTLNCVADAATAWSNRSRVGRLWRRPLAPASPSLAWPDVAPTFSFATDSKSFVPTFNCSIRNMSKCWTSRLLVHLCLQASFFISWMRLHRRDSKHGRIRQGQWHRQWRDAMIELYVLLCPCVKTMQIFMWRLWIFIDLRLFVSKLYVLLYKSTVWPVLEAPHPGRQPNTRSIHIKNQYILRFIEECVGIYSPVNRGIYGHVVGANGGGSQYILRLYVIEKYILIYLSVMCNRWIYFYIDRRYIRRLTEEYMYIYRL